MHYYYQKMHRKHEKHQKILSLQKECYTRPRVSGVQSDVTKSKDLCEYDHLQAVLSYYQYIYTCNNSW